MTPTWYDVPGERAADRSRSTSAAPPNHPRQHLAWNTDRNRSLVKGMNKDWQGRPGFFNAYMASYFAARQWIRGIRAWVGDDAFWARAQRYATRYGCRARPRPRRRRVDRHDDSGHWQGQGEPCDPQWSTNVCGDRNGPGGDVLCAQGRRRELLRGPRAHALPQAVREARDPAGRASAAAARSRSRSRRPPSCSARRASCALQVMSMRAITLRRRSAPTTPTCYARATIGGQRFQSGEINGHDSYSLPASPTRRSRG